MTVARAKIHAMDPAPSEISKNLANVCERIHLAASRSGRTSKEITLVAVTKNHSARKIQDLHQAGARHFGENRVQERESKLAQLQGLDAIWHMIGHLQKNKAARAAPLFNSVDSVDSAALAEKLDRAMAEFITENNENLEAGTGSTAFVASNRLRVLIEVKLDPEPAKSGVECEDVPRLARSHPANGPPRFARPDGCPALLR